MTYPEARDFLYQLRYHGAKYGLERVERFVEALGHPERAFPIIHVAGTNGKGSTCAMLERMVREAGYKTGLFTSPHLVHQGERIQVDRQLMTEAEIADATNALATVGREIEAATPGMHPSFFEFMAAMAFTHFRDAGVDMGVIEVGLGGRLDATNVVRPEVSIITSISFDHTEILGDTLTKIAFEKGGIIKPGTPVVLGELPEEAEIELRRIANERNAPLQTIREAWPDGDYPETSLSGDFQRRNAATALLALRAIRDRFPIDETLARRALLDVDWAGRWDERPLQDGKHLILDATHNEEGARQLDLALTDLRRRLPEAPIIFVGSLGEKRAASLMDVVSRHAREIILLRPDQPRALSFDDLRAAIPAHYTGPVREAEIADCFPRPGVASLGAPGETLVATGSIYLIGEIAEAITNGTREASTLQD